MDLEKRTEITVADQEQIVTDLKRKEGNHTSTGYLLAGLAVIFGVAAGEAKSPSTHQALPYVLGAMGFVSAMGSNYLGALRTKTAYKILEAKEHLDDLREGSKQ